MSYILVSGISVVDFIFSVSSLPTSAEKYRADSASIICGGVAMNAAVGISRLGGLVRLSTGVSDDMLGGLIYDTLESEQVLVDYIVRFPDISSFSSVYIDSSGERQIVSSRSPSMDFVSGRLGDMLMSSSVPVPSAVLVDPHFGETATNLLLRAREWDIPGVIDGESNITSSQISAASHVAFSRQGLCSVCDNPDLSVSLREVSSEYPDKWMCVTDGAHGIHYTSSSGIDYLPAFDVVAKDTLGAGDLWHGAFTLQLSRGIDIVSCMKFANACSAVKCQRFGGQSTFPNLSEVEEFLKSRDISL